MSAQLAQRLSTSQGSPESSRPALRSIATANLSGSVYPQTGLTHHSSADSWAIVQVDSRCRPVLIGYELDFPVNLPLEEFAPRCARGKRLIADYPSDPPDRCSPDRRYRRDQHRCGSHPTGWSEY